MPSDLVIYIDVETIEERFGVWCPHCLVPSAWDFTLCVMANGTPMNVISASFCQDCGADLSSLH
jgi:hypothetical protein